MFAERCPSRTSSIKVYDGADEVCGDVLLVDVRCFGPPVSEPIAFLTLVTVAIPLIRRDWFVVIFRLSAARPGGQRRAPARAAAR